MPRDLTMMAKDVQFDCWVDMKPQITITALESVPQTPMLWKILPGGLGTGVDSW